MNSDAALAQKLVLFDLDNTLLNGDSDYEWGQFLCDIGVLDSAKHRAQNKEFYAAYQAGTLDIHNFLSFQLAPLSRYPRAQLEAWRSTYIRERIAPLIGAKATALIASHRSPNTLMAIVTATNSFITGPIASCLDCPHLIATVPAVNSDGNFTGAPRGNPAFQAGKITMLEAWLEARGMWWSSFQESWFYSDSMNDLPLLQRVTHPVCVDPDPRLATHAHEHGWEIITLRNNSGK